MLYDRIALITSATRFAGKGTARAMLDAGAKVICHDALFIQPAARKAFEADIAGVATVPGQSPAAIVAEAEAFHGRIDILVNNDAYPAIRAPIEEAKMDDYRAAFEAMTIRPFEITQRVVPGMKARKFGRIIFMSSSAPLRGLANYAPYTSVRAATNGLVSSLAKELGRYAITVNAIGSNYVENPDYFPPALVNDKAAMAKMTANIPLGRLGKPEEIAATATFLASDGAGFITGHVLPHSGGWA